MGRDNVWRALDEPHVLLLALCYLQTLSGDEKEARMKHLRLVRPLVLLTLAEKRAAVGRDFKREPWATGEGARFFTAERVARMAAENEAARKDRAAKVQQIKRVAK